MTAIEIVDCVAFRRAFDRHDQATIERASLTAQDLKYGQYVLSAAKLNLLSMPGRGNVRQTVERQINDRLNGQQPIHATTHLQLV